MALESILRYVSMIEIDYNRTAALEMDLPCLEFQAKTI